MIVEVAINVPIRKCFDYYWPENFKPVPEPGLQVLVPFGRQKIGGVVVDVEAVPVSDLGEGGLVDRVHVLARGCFGEAVSEKAVIAHFFYENRGGLVCRDGDGACQGQLLGGCCQDLSRLGPDQPGKVD